MPFYVLFFSLVRMSHTCVAAFNCVSDFAKFLTSITFSLVMFVTFVSGFHYNILVVTSVLIESLFTPTFSTYTASWLIVQVAKDQFWENHIAKNRAAAFPRSCRSCCFINAFYWYYSLCALTKIYLYFLDIFFLAFCGACVDCLRRDFLSVFIQHNKMRF